MIQNAAELELENEILDRLTGHSNTVKLDMVDDNLLTVFEYKQLVRKANSVNRPVRKYVLLALLELNYSKNIVNAEKYFNTAILNDSSDIPTWTSFVAFLSARGFPSKANDYAKRALDYLNCPATVHNALVRAVQVLDLFLMEKCVHICKELRYVGEKWQPSNFDKATVLIEEINNLMQTVNYDHRLVTHILTTVQEAVCNHGYVIQGSLIKDKAAFGELRVSYTVNETDLSKIGDLNMHIADLFAENDWLDCKVVVFIMPHGA